MKTKPDYEFFNKHCDTITPQNQSYAGDLARAEAWAKDHGIEYRWEEELEPWNRDEPLPPQTELLTVGVFQGDICLAAMGMVCVKSPSFIQGIPRDPYIRVVQAELALEAFHELESNPPKSPPLLAYLALEQALREYETKNPGDELARVEWRIREIFQAMKSLLQKMDPVWFAKRSK